MHVLMNSVDVSPSSHYPFYNDGELGMVTPELTCLEAQIEQLLKVLQELRAENKTLRNQIARITREKNLIYQNNQKVASNIKNVIHSLKEALP